MSLKYFNINFGLLLILASCSHASKIADNNQLDERLGKLETIVAQQDEVNKQQAEIIRTLEFKAIQQEMTIKKQEERIKTQGETLKMLYRIEEVKSQKHGHDFMNISYTARRDANVQIPFQRNARQYERIAFSAYLDHTVSNPGIDQAIIYNKPLINEGSAYNEHSGIFTCPMDGIYGFYFSVATVHVNQIVAKLVVNSVNEVDGVADTFHTNQEAQGSNFVFVSLTKGQQVWVANYRWATHTMQESEVYRFSSFSGFLLY